MGIMGAFAHLSIYRRGRQPRRGLPRPLPTRPLPRLTPREGAVGARKGTPTFRCLQSSARNSSYVPERPPQCRQIRGFVVMRPQKAHANVGRGRSSPSSSRDCTASTESTSPNSVVCSSTSRLSWRQARNKRDRQYLRPGSPVAFSQASPQCRDSLWRRLCLTCSP